MGDIAYSSRVLDIDFGQNEIISRHGKGDKDRHVMLPQSLIPELEEHLTKVKQIHDRDLSEGWGSVTLPGDYEELSSLIEKRNNLRKTHKYGQPTDALSEAEDAVINCVKVIS